MMKKTTALFVLVVVISMLLMVTPAIAAVVPSVSAKPAPTIAKIVDENNKPALAVVRNQDGTTKYLYGAEDLTITPVSSMDLLNENQKKLLQDVYNMLSDANDTAYRTALESFVTSQYANLNYDKFVARDLFDLEIPDDIRNTLSNTNKLEIIFETSFSVDDRVLVCVYNTLTEEMDFVDSEDVIIQENGNLLVRFSHLCPVALLVYEDDGQDITAITDEVKTGDQSGLFTWLIVLGAAIIVIVILLIIQRNKKKK